MNDFESELKKHPIRTVPEHWRGQILGGARISKRELQPWWAALLWPSPKAWGALAAAWVVIIGFSAVTRESSLREEAPEATQIRMAMEEKQRLQAEIEEASLHLDQQPKPRSEAIHDSRSV